MSSLFQHRSNQPSLMDLARQFRNPQEAQQRIQQMLQSGQITQEQYNQALKWANDTARRMGLI